MLTTVVLFNIFVETVMHLFQYYLMNRKFKNQHLFEMEIFCKVINVFTVTLFKLLHKILLTPYFWTVVYLFTNLSF